LCALYNAYNGERAWKDIGNRSQAPYYLSKVDHFWKIRATMIRADIGKFVFVNRTITEWNQLPEGAIGTFPVKMLTFRRRVLLLLLEWLYSPVGPRLFFTFLIYSIHNRQESLNE
jgi:hypothetical protein